LPGLGNRYSVRIYTGMFVNRYRIHNNIMLQIDNGTVFFVFSFINNVIRNVNYKETRKEQYFVIMT